MKIRVWKSDWFTALLITLFFLTVANSNFIGSIERNAYDFGVKSSTHIPNSKIAIIAIDDQSIRNIGRWPWPRNIHAKMFNLLKAGGAKIIGDTVFFSEPQIDPGLQYIHKLKQFFKTSSMAAVPALVNKLNLRINKSLHWVRKKRDTNGRIAIQKISHALKNSFLSRRLPAEIDTYLKYINSIEVALDTDNQLAKAIQAAGNVVLAMPFIPGKNYGQPDHNLPDYITQNQVPRANIINTVRTNPEGYAPLTMAQALPPIPLIGKQAKAIGALVTLPDIDGAIRTEPLIINYYGSYYPSMALLLAAKSLNLNVDDIKVTIGSDVELGRLKIKTDRYSLMNTFFYHDRNNQPAFTVDSFYDVLTGKIPASKYAGKIVLIGATALGVGDVFVTPINPAMSAVITLAHSVSSILNEDFFIEPYWGAYARLGAVLLIALYLMFVLPQLGAAVGFIFTAILLAALFITYYLMMTTQGIWLQLMMPMLLLATGHIILTTKHYLLTEKDKVRMDIESAESNRMLGLSMQGQGQLDMAFEKFRKLPLGNLSMEVFYNLALDYERKRQFNKAKSIYAYMAEFNPRFRDIKARSSRAQSLEETVILSGGNTLTGNLTLGGNGLENPMLGRYEIERELAKGAMGAVYLGKDPKISRIVAIKTMALSQEFEADELIEVKRRFFREAETAGRLTHQHIVTIYDVGEEHDLAYIAMEFLEGTDLRCHIKPDTLLPITEVLSIIQRCAQGLDYAHRHNVVHRDIKPANIMWDKQTDTLKITDFGIARITNSSRTKTGMILGTPSYMSPEQLAGKKVTGQSDLFSLGVMLFQMVTGQLPFKADSLTALMYTIANKPHPDPNSIKAEIPRYISFVINRAMNKSVEKRYKTGKQMAHDIAHCLKIITLEKKT